MTGRGVDWLARRVRELRTERSLSRADLAAASGLDPETIDAIEAGDSSASLSTMRALGKGLGMRLSELFQGLDGPEGLSIGARVRMYRRAQNRTIAELAAVAGLDRDQLEQIETDQHRPDLAMIRTLATALGKSVGELVGKG